MMYRVYVLYSGCSMWSRVYIVGGDGRRWVKGRVVAICGIVYNGLYVFVCGMYMWVHVTFVCVVAYTICRGDLYCTGRHDTCVSRSGASGTHFSAVIVRRLFYYWDREYVFRGGGHGVLV